MKSKYIPAGISEFSFPLIILAILLSRILDSPAGGPLIIGSIAIHAATNWLYTEKPPKQLSADLVDISITSLLILEVLGYSTSGDSSNRLPDFYDVLCLILFYFLIRHHRFRDRQLAIVFGFVTLMGVAFGIWAIHKSFQQYEGFGLLGIHDLTNFKSLVSFPNPAGIVSGAWVTIFLLFLPFPILLLLKNRLAYISSLNDASGEIHHTDSGKVNASPGYAGDNEQAKITAPRRPVFR